jgi:peptidoglycan-associated lipoprotein
MQMKQGLALLLCVGSLWIAGCATETSTKPPQVEEKGTTTTAPEQGGEGTQALPEGGESKAGPIGGTAADADLLAKRRVHFAFDSSELDGENRQIVEAHARYLAANPNLHVTLEGHCDERGTREYNLALGERRAQAVARVMRVLGVSANSLTLRSYGEEKPLDPAHNESAWALNRRVEIIYQ